MPSSRHVRMTRIAISPRLAMRILDGNGTTGPSLRVECRRILRSMPEPAATRRVRSAGVPGAGPAWAIRTFTSLDSTNRYLLDEARAGAPDGLVAVTDHQSAGRGRLGRVWEAAPGS